MLAHALFAMYTPPDRLVSKETSPWLIVPLIDTARVPEKHSQSAHPHEQNRKSRPAYSLVSSMDSRPKQNSF